VSRTTNVGTAVRPELKAASHGKVRIGTATDRRREAHERLRDAEEAGRESPEQHTGGLAERPIHPVQEVLAWRLPKLESAQRHAHGRGVAPVYT
jgi:hypothetical protein